MLDKKQKYAEVEYIFVSQIASDFFVILHEFTPPLRKHPVFWKILQKKLQVAWLGSTLLIYVNLSLTMG